MSRKSEIVQTLNESAPTRRESMYMGSHQLKIVMAAGAKRPGGAQRAVGRMPSR